MMILFQDFGVDRYIRVNSDKKVRPKLNYSTHLFPTYIEKCLAFQGICKYISALHTFQFPFE